MVVSEIKSQVRLPLAVAFEVAVQGIRIRLGRSLITLMGIALGIAFLMSILMAQACRKGVALETNMRAEAQRMLSFLIAETGPLRGRKLAVLQTGSLDQRETRFVEKLLRETPSQIDWAAVGESTTLRQLPRDASVRQAADAASAMTDAAGTVVLGDGALPETDWQSLLSKARNPVLAFSRASQMQMQPEGAVILEYKPKQEEIEEMEAEARRASFRTVWIVVISLLVTVIGVSNAMLMSVTERFREIGTMKCLGALSRFIRQLFLMESLMMGVVGSTIGSIFGALFSFIVFGITYGFGLVAASVSWTWVTTAMLASIAAGIALAIAAAIYPAGFAARMVPATALRSNV